MQWRSYQWSVGWAFLEPTLLGASILASVYALAAGVRIRFRRSRSRRPLVPVFVRRLIALLGVALPLSSVPTCASARSSAHPGRFGRTIHEAPWSGTSGFTPPRPLVPSGRHTMQTRSVHPAIHVSAKRAEVAIPLFERAAARAERERRESRRLHPSGNPQAVEVADGRRMKVKAGDCLWQIAADDLNTDDPPRIDKHWRAIFRANHAIIGADPNRLVPGQVLRLPEDSTE